MKSIRTADLTEADIAAIEQAKPRKCGGMMPKRKGAAAPVAGRLAETAKR